MLALEARNVRAYRQLFFFLRNKQTNKQKKKKHAIKGARTDEAAEIWTNISF